MPALYRGAPLNANVRAQMDSPTLYILIVLGTGVIVGCATGLLKTSTLLVSIGAAVFLWIKAGAIPFLLGAIAVYAGVAGLGAWIGVEIRSLTLLLARAPANSHVHAGITDEISTQARNIGRPTQAGDPREAKGRFAEAICCPHCGAASIDRWDKLMSGLIGRHCICENCGKSSREERRQRLVTSIIFLGALWLVSQLPSAGGLIALAVWAILFIVVEWQSIYRIPLVPVVDSERWKKTKDVFAWIFVGLVLATFVFTAIVNLL